MTGSIVRTHATLKALSRDTRNKLIRKRQRAGHARCNAAQNGSTPPEEEQVLACAKSAARPHAPAYVSVPDVYTRIGHAQQLIPGVSGQDTQTKCYEIGYRTRLVIGNRIELLVARPRALNLCRIS